MSARVHAEMCVCKISLEHLAQNGRKSLKSGIVKDGAACGFGESERAGLVAHGRGGIFLRIYQISRKPDLGSWTRHAALY